MRRQSPRSTVAFCLFAAALVAGPVASQEAPEAFFKDKTIRVLVGHPPGGSYDFYARLAADMLRVYLPQAKAVIVETKPGGGGLIATSWFYAQAPRDGTVLGLLPETIGNTQLMEPDVGRWKAEAMRYVGSFSPVNTAFMRRRNSPSQTLADMRVKETIVGCTGTNAQSYQYPALLKVLGGYKFKMICGYPGAAEYTVALERGEIDLVSSAWNSWKVTHADKIANGDLVAVVQAGLKRNKELADVPLMQEAVEDATARKVIDFTSAGAMIGRALLAPPEVPAARLAYLRGLFDKMVRDPAMIAMAAQRRLDLEPLPGAAVQVFSDEIVRTPTEIVEKAVAAFKG